MIESIVASIISSTVYNQLSKILSLPSGELKKNIFEAIESSINNFFKEYGDKYEHRYDSFLAREENWQLLFRSFFYSADLFSAESINRKGFNNAPEATYEEVEYFIEQFIKAIKSYHHLDKIITEKNFMSKVVSSQDLILSELGELKNNTNKIDNITPESNSQEEFFISLNENFEIKDPSKLKLTLDELFHALHEDIDHTIHFEIDIYTKLVADIKNEKQKEKPDRKRLLKLREAADLFWIAGKEPEFFLRDIIKISILNFYRNPNRIRLSINQLSTMITYCFKNIRTNIANEGGTKFEIFHYKIDHWYSRIYLNDKELSELMKRHGVGSSLVLTRNFGLDLYDLTEATRVEKVIPALIFEYLGFKYHESLEIPDSSQFFRLGNWKMGLG